MKKIITFSLVAVMALTFTGCSLTDKLMNKAEEKIGEKIVEKATNSEIDVTNKSVTVNTNEGTTAFGEDLALPEGYPEDVPTYQEAKVISSSTSAQNNSFYVTMLSTDDFKAVADYYNDELTNQGWKIDNSSTYNTNSLRSETFICSKDNRDLTVGLYEIDDGEGNKEVSIAISIADKPVTE